MVKMPKCLIVTCDKGPSNPPKNQPSKPALLLSKNCDVNHRFAADKNPSFHRVLLSFSCLFWLQIHTHSSPSPLPRSTPHFSPHMTPLQPLLDPQLPPTSQPPSLSGFLSLSSSPWPVYRSSSWRPHLIPLFFLTRRTPLPAQMPTARNHPVPQMSILNQSIPLGNPSANFVATSTACFTSLSWE